MRASSTGRPARLVKLTRQGRQCPACGSARSEAVARKYVVTELRRCRQCELLFRAPTTPEARSDEFYQEEYTDGVTTTTPTDAELDNMLASGFKGSEKDYARYIAVLDALGVPKGARVFEFGCSWGGTSRRTDARLIPGRVPAGRGRSGWA